MVMRSRPRNCAHLATETGGRCTPIRRRPYPPRSEATLTTHPQSGDRSRLSRLNDAGKGFSYQIAPTGAYFLEKYSVQFPGPASHNFPSYKSRFWAIAADWRVGASA